MDELTTFNTHSLLHCNEPSTSTATPSLAATPSSASPLAATTQHHLSASTIATAVASAASTAASIAAIAVSEDDASAAHAVSEVAAKASIPIPVGLMTSIASAHLIYVWRLLTHCCDSCTV